MASSAPVDEYGRAKMRHGLLAMAPSSLTVDVAKFFPYIPAGEIYHLTMIHGDFREKPEPGEPTSFVLTALAESVRGSLDVLAVSGGLLLFATDWHKCLLIMARNLVKPGGKLVMPVKSTSVPTMAQGLPMSLVSDWLELKHEPHAPGQVCFTIPGPQPLPRSTISWMAGRGPDYLRRTLGENVPRAAGDFAALGLRQLGASFAKLNTPFLGMAPAHPQLPGRIPRSRFNDLEYLGIGAGQKFAAIKTTFDRYMGQPAGFRFLDHGGALGLIPGQALFESGMDTAAITIVEPLGSFQAMAEDFFDYLTPEQRAKVAYEKSFAQTYRYAETYHGIGFIHMFFLIDEAERQATFARAFDALAEGGVVLLWEVPKTPASEKAHYYDRMMTSDEIMAMCSPYATLACLDPRNMEEVDERNFINKPLVRVLRKKNAEGR